MAGHFAAAPMIPQRYGQRRWRMAGGAMTSDRKNRNVGLPTPSFLRSMQRDRPPDDDAP